MEVLIFILILFWFFRGMGGLDEILAKSIVGLARIFGK
jgi:hypothetical protein